jgi:hypothetical protein
MSVKNALRLSPFLYSVYPVVALLSVNLGQVRTGDVVRPILASLLGAAVLLVALRLVTGDWSRAAVLSCGLLVLFYAYGHVYVILKTWRIGEFVVGRHRFLAPVALLVCLAWLWWGSRRARALGQLQAFFAVAGIVGLALPCLTIARYGLAVSGSTWQNAEPTAGSVPVLSLAAGAATPDIYFIIVDAYGREDVLRDFYAYDNSEFLNFLRGQGFYIASAGHSNYHKTDLSLSSALNMQYLHVLAEEMGRSPESNLPLAEMIDHSRVRQALAGLGYRFVAFDTGVPYTTLEDADIYISPRLPSFLPRTLTEFEVMLLRTTAFRILLDGYLQGRQGPGTPDAALADLQRQRVLLTLDTLPQIPSWDGQYFVYAHVAIPHPPFLFERDGSPRPLAGEFSLLDGQGFAGPPEEYVDGYLAQLEYLNARLREILPRIIEESDVPPIIILQGDHGPRLHTVWEDSEATNMREGMGNLEAFFLPGGGENRLYPTISPVNEFRVVFDEYFGADLGLLEDDSFFLVELSPFLYDKVTDRVQTD